MATKHKSETMGNNHEPLNQIRESIDNINRLMSGDDYKKIKSDLSKLTTELNKLLKIADPKKYTDLYLEMERLANAMPHLSGKATSSKSQNSKGSDRDGKLIAEVFNNIASRLHGQDEMIKVFLACMLAQINVSLVGDSGCGKTFLAKCFRDACGLKSPHFQMIVGHSEVMESNFVGSMLPGEDGKWKPNGGPLSPNEARLLIVDEYNRINPRSLAHLLEPMNDKQNEKQEWLGMSKKNGSHYFNIMLAMNPVSQGGNYPAPDAILDRIGYQYFAEPLSEDAIKAIVAGKAIKLTGEARAGKNISRVVRGVRGLSGDGIFEAFVSMRRTAFNNVKDLSTLISLVTNIVAKLKSPRHFILECIRNKTDGQFWEKKSSLEAAAIHFETDLADLEDEQVSDKHFEKILKKMLGERDLAPGKFSQNDLKHLVNIRKLLSSATARMGEDLLSFTVAYAYVTKKISGASQSHISIDDSKAIIRIHAANLLIHRMKFSTPVMHEQVLILDKIIAHALATPNGSIS